MSNFTLPQLVAAAAVTACCLGSLRAQEADPVATIQEHINAAKELERDKQTEDAALALRKALGSLPAVTDSSRRRTLQKTIDNQLKRIDPLHAEAARACKRASRSLALLAEADIKRGWLRYAAHSIEAAERITPDSAGDQRAALAAAAASSSRGKGETGPTKIGGGSIQEQWFASFENPMGEGGWKLQPSHVSSPATGGRSIMIASNRAISGTKCTISCAVRANEAPGKYAVVFDLTEELQYHLLELRCDLGFSEARLFRWDGRQMHELGSQLVTLTRAERRGWLPLTIEIDGQSIRGVIGNGFEEVRGKTRSENLAGKIGLFVSGDSQRETPIDFRLTSVQTGGR